MPSSMRLCLTVLFSAFLSTFLLGQEPGEIALRNPSFEDLPRNSAAPRGWTDCGFPGETPPDVHPDPEFAFRVAKEAQHGQTYLGMVTRDNETYESVGQILSSSMVAGQCYELNLQMARSQEYYSKSHRTLMPANYVTPAVLRIYGGYGVCSRGEKIGESQIVSNYHWGEYRVRLKPTEAYTHLILEVYYKPQTMIPYNGNILLDNARPLKPIDCDKDLSIPDAPPADALSPPVTFEDPDGSIETAPVTPRVVDTPEPDAGAQRPAPAAPEAPKVKLGTTTATLKEGQIFRIEAITFKANSAEIEQASEDALQEIVGFLNQNDNIIIEVGGHASYKASSEYANNLSQERARSVVTWLNEHSIPTTRMFPQGYGKSRPVCVTADRDCNTRNQRVEVKILRLSR